MYKSIAKYHEKIIQNNVQSIASCIVEKIFFLCANCWIPLHVSAKPIFSDQRLHWGVLRPVVNNKQKRWFLPTLYHLLRKSKGINTRKLKASHCIF